MRTFSRVWVSPWVFGHLNPSLLEGERLVDTANTIIESTETTETKLKKERKKLIKKSTPPINQLEMVEERISKIQLDKIQAESEFSSKQKDQNNLKSKRLKEALKQFSNGQLTLCKKGQILFEAGNAIIDHVPEIVLHEDTNTKRNELIYSGGASTTQIVIHTKEKLKNFNSESSPILPILPPAYEKLDHISQQPPVNPYIQNPTRPEFEKKFKTQPEPNICQPDSSLLPTYDKLHQIQQQPPVNPYYRPSPNLPSKYENYDRNTTTTIPNSSITRSSTLDYSSSYSSRNLYPDLSNSRRIYDYRNRYQCL